MDVNRYYLRYRNAILDLMFPRFCLACDLPLRSDEGRMYICSRCAGQLRPVSAGFAQINILDRLHPCHLDDVRIAFRFNEVIRQLIHPLKYRKMPLVGTELGLLAAIDITDLGLITPVPLHKLRLKERGYNQSEYIARGLIGNSAQLDFQPQLIRRIRATSTQTRLSRQQREENLADAFVIRPYTGIESKCIGVVDDVITTGTTLNECARLLKKAGAAKVVAIALAAPVREVEVLDPEQESENNWLW